jgi:predicted AAA+ superfamily ATPase
MNELKSLSDILKHAFDHFPNSKLIFDGFSFDNRTISYKDLKSHLDIVLFFKT